MLLSLGNYTDVARAKSQRWKDLLGNMTSQVTNGAEIVEKGQNELATIVDFWEGVKTNNPVAHLNTILTAVEKGKRNLEFACKCVRRAMEMPDCNLVDLQETLESKI